MSAEEPLASVGHVASGSMPEWLPEVFGVLEFFAGLIESAMDAREEAAYRKEVLHLLASIDGTLRDIDAKLDALGQKIDQLRLEQRDRSVNEALDHIKSQSKSVNGVDFFADPPKPFTLEDIDATVYPMQAVTSAIRGPVVNETHTKLIAHLTIDELRDIDTILRQGLVVLAYKCAHSDFRYGTYVWQWAREFRSLWADAIALRDEYPLVVPRAWPTHQVHVGDTIALYRDLSPAVEGVGLYVDDLKGAPHLVHSGTLTYRTISGEGRRTLFHPLTITPPPDAPFVTFADLTLHEVPRDGRRAAFVFVDRETGQSTLDPTTDLAAKCMSPARSHRYVRVLLSLGPFGHDATTVASSAVLCAAARGRTDQTFLGAVDGRLAWVADGTPLVGCIYDGTTRDAPMPVLSTSGTVESVEASARGDAFDLGTALWRVTWAGAENRIRIACGRTGATDAPHLTLDASGAWHLAEADANPLVVTPDPPTRVPMGDPLVASPATVWLGSEAKPKQRQVFFARV